MAMHSNAVAVSHSPTNLEWNCGQIRAWNHTLVRRVVGSGALERLGMSPEDVYGELAVVFVRISARFTSASYCSNEARLMEFYKVASQNHCRDVVKRAYRGKRSASPVGESGGVDLDALCGRSPDPSAVVEIPNEFVRIVNLVVTGEATTVTAACLSVGMSRSVAAAMKKKIENWARDHATTA